MSKRFPGSKARNHETWHGAVVKLPISQGRLSAFVILAQSLVWPWVGYLSLTASVSSHVKLGHNLTYLKDLLWGLNWHIVSKYLYQGLAHSNNLAKLWKDYFGGLLEGKFWVHYISVTRHIHGGVKAVRNISIQTWSMKEISRLKI